MKHFNEEQKTLWHQFGDMLNQVETPDIRITGRAFNECRKSFIVMVTTPVLSSFQKMNPEIKEKVDQLIKNGDKEQAIYLMKNNRTDTISKNSRDSLIWDILASLVHVIKLNFNDTQKLKELKEEIFKVCKSF